MFYQKRVYNVANSVWIKGQAKDKESSLAVILARLLTETYWTLCTAFTIGEYYFVNDATSEDGAGEWAILRKNPNGSFDQVETITFGWLKVDKASTYISKILRGGYKTPIVKDVEFKTSHVGKCRFCA